MEKRMDSCQLLKQTYGKDNHSMAEAFYEFLRQQRIKQDIGVSITQLDNGEGIPLERAISKLKSIVRHRLSGK